MENSMIRNCTVAVLFAAHVIASSVAAGQGCPDQPAVDPSPVPAPGGPFDDCGLQYSDAMRSPSPTRLPHAYLGLEGLTLCILPFSAQTWQFPNLPTIEIGDSNTEIHNSAQFPGDVVFTGHHIKWISDIGFGSVEGEYICAPGADQIEVDGECLCPVPEPSFSLGVGVPAFGLAWIWTSRRRAAGIGPGHLSAAEG